MMKIVKLVIIPFFSVFALSGCFQEAGETIAEKYLDQADPGRNADRSIKKPATEVTDPVEQYKLGMAYAKKGLHYYAKEVVHLYTQSANQGNIDAQAALGKFYYKDAKSVLVKHYEQDLTEAVSWFKRASDQGHIISMMSLGEIYQQGGTGLLKDPEQSKHFYSKGITSYKAKAEKGDVTAQYTLGSIYKDGKATQKDLSEAMIWLEKAALNGHKNAQFEMGREYSSGLGVEKDFVRGLAWYEVARYYGMKFTSVFRHKEEDIAKAVVISKELIQQIEENKKQL